MVINIIAQEGFSAHNIEVNTRGVGEHFRTDGLIRMHSGNHHALDVRIDAVRKKGQNPPSLSLTTFKS